MFENIETLDEHNERYHRPSTFFEVRESAFQKAAVSYILIYDAKNMITPAEAQNCINNLVYVYFLLPETVRRHVHVQCETCNFLSILYLFLY